MIINSLWVGTTSFTMLYESEASKVFNSQFLYFSIDIFKQYIKFKYVCDFFWLLTYYCVKYIDWNTWWLQEI
jgi:hypothetical protein